MAFNAGDPMARPAPINKSRRVTPTWGSFSRSDATLFVPPVLEYVERVLSKLAFFTESRSGQQPRSSRVIFSRPCGTLRLSNPTQDCRPGLHSAVPTGLFCGIPNSLFVRLAVALGGAAPRRYRPM